MGWPVPATRSAASGVNLTLCVTPGGGSGGFPGVGAYKGGLHGRSYGGGGWVWMQMSCWGLTSALSVLSSPREG